MLLLFAVLSHHSPAGTAVQDTVLVAPAPHYAARGPLAWLTRLVFGERHRVLWTTAIPMPVIDTAALASAVEVGTGLREGFRDFRDANGVLLTFRPLDRRLEGLIRETSRRQVVTGPVQDFMSGRHPGAALVAPPLAHAAGVEMADARLAAWPTSNGLVAGALSPRAGDENAITSRELLRRLGEPGFEAVDTETYLRGRLLDVYLNHWDFRPGEWRWTRDSAGRWTPLPRDRDGAFARFDGLLGLLGARFTGELSSFGDRYAPRLAVTGPTRTLDARLLADVAATGWDAVARDLRSGLTDSVIAAAVARLPAAWRGGSAPRLERELRARRDRLLDASARLRDMTLAHGSAGDEGREAPRRSTTRVLPWLALGSDHGIRLGPEITHAVLAGDRTLRARYRLHGGYATASAAFAIGGRAEWWIGGAGTRLGLDARLSSLDVLRFYGFSNETARDEDDTYYRADQRVVAVAPSVEWAVAPDARVGLGLVVKHVTTRDRGERLMQVLQPYGWDGFAQAGMTAAVILRRKVTLTATGAYYPGVLDAEEPFGRIGVSGSVTASPPGLDALTVSVRLAGERAYGRYPVHEAVQLGGAHSVRSLKSRRYTGDAAAYGNLDVRLRVATVPFVMPWDLGVLGIADLGRVWLDGERSRRWHQGLGGGLWMALPDRSFLVVADVVRGDDGTVFWVGTGFGF